MKMKSYFFILAGLIVSIATPANQKLNDTLVEKQWGLDNFGQTILRSSGELTRDQVVGSVGMDIDWVSMEDYKIPEDREIVVAILDSGLDVGHPDLKGRVFIDRKLCPEGEDNSKKPCSGINVLDQNLDLTDDTGHGTHIAGIIAAVRNNKLGVAGVADDRIKILPIKVLSKQTNDFVFNNRVITDYFADGIQYALERGADVINMSIGWPKLIESPKMKRALEVAAQRNVAIVVAAGNNNKQIPTYPCTSPNVICVGAVDNQGKIAEFSNFGGKVDILAPGEFIVSTYPLNEVESRILRIKGYESKKGTSQAAPYVAAIAASLKLQNPEISLDELKGRLYAGTKQVNLSATGDKFSKFGLVSMKKALESKPETFLMPIFKNLLDVNVDYKTGEFFFSVPVKSLIRDESSVKFSIESERKDVVFNTPNDSVNLQKGRESRVLVKGQIKDLDSDNQVKIVIKLRNNAGIEFITQTSIVFARDLSREIGTNKEIKVSPIENFEANELTFFRGFRKVLRTKKVENSEGLQQSPAYFVQTNAAQTEELTVLDFLRNKESRWIKERVELSKLNEVVAAYDSDLNVDGVKDLLVIGVNVEQNRLTFDYLLSDEKGALGSSRRIQFPLLDYRGFPIDYKDMANFSFYSIQTAKGILKVPSYFANFTMPDQDNTDDLLDRIPSELNLPHLYYLNPIKKIDGEEFELRVVDTFSLIEKVRDQFQVGPWLGLFIEKPFPQSSKERREGVVKGFITAGEEFARRYFIYTAQASNVSFEEVFFPNHLIAGNSSRGVLGMNDSELGQLTSQVNFVAQLKRDEVRSFVWSPLELKSKSLEVSTKNWSDPVFDTISTFADSAGTNIFETRYYIRAFDNQGNDPKLRINRESSFPGVKFSETLSPIIVNSGKKKLPSVFINSTLIFGSRLYSMVKNGSSFTRPISLSVDVPNNCIHMEPEVLEASFQYMLLCKGSGKSINLVTMPAKLKAQ
jgi:cell wall-associated protease